MRKLFSPAAILAIFIFDRLSKAWTLAHIPFRSVAVLPFFRLTYAENTGVAFGMFHGNNLFFIAVGAGLVAALLFFRRRIMASGIAAEAGLALVLGGALGNLYDRLVYGFVVDFFDFSFFPAVFNVADSSITAGAVLLALGMKERVESGKRSAE